MQPCKTGDQPHSDASPNGECSLIGLFKLTSQDSGCGKFDCRCIFESEKMKI